ncbi:predicted protein [Histoplasma capsulatum G186AR]|uniref:Uncharacterized protein n=1 Tax=Ajellomyces capsulatus (strain G186AR / H82 / ATCC MYA-2454 / RMSCC 2432) TaxID=447093 RepID=C0NEL7_AJECG|nr:uncharacterized protein HCBG_01333 [Histoplasma capsulatum G186AR]EEH09688.1 predicted protein [Histoplasma capsulatum G186AR]
MTRLCLGRGGLSAVCLKHPPWPQYQTLFLVHHERSGFLHPLRSSLPLIHLSPPFAPCVSFALSGSDLSSTSLTLTITSPFPIVDPLNGLPRRLSLLEFPSDRILKLNYPDPIAPQLFTAKAIVPSISVPSFPWEYLPLVLRISKFFNLYIQICIYTKVPPQADRYPNHRKSFRNLLAQFLYGLGTARKAVD